MTRDEVRQIIESTDEQDDKITLLLNRFQAEKSQIRNNPELQQKADDLEGQLATANSKIKELRKQLTDTKSELKTSEEEVVSSQELLTKLQEKDTQIEALQKEITDGKISNAVNIVLAQAGVKNQKFASMITNSIDMSVVEIDKDGNVTGIEEQINAMKEDEDTAMLFRSAPKNDRQSYNPLRGENKDINTFAELFEKERAEKPQMDPADDPFYKALK